MATAQVSSVFTARETMVRTMKNIEGSATRLDKVFGSLRGRIRTAFEMHVVNRGLMLFERGVRELVGIVPDLINRGRQWAGTVDAISDATGLSAERASELAAVQQRLGGSTDSLVRGFAAMSKSVYTNRDAWKDMGVAVAKNASGGVDAYETFQNLRRAVSETGGSLLSTKAAQDAFGRSGKDVLDLLQLTDKQYRILADDARRSGQVMTDEAAAAAEALDRAQARFGSTMDGLGTRILNGIGPVLTRFVDGFTTFVQDNMDSIVRFVVGGANTILTVIGELIGADLGSWSFSEELGKIKGEGKGAGDGIKHVTKEQQRHATATRDTTSAVRGLHDAQRDLQRLQSSSIGFTGDKSEYERERARQARIMAIKEAQQRVADARKTLNEIEKGARTAGVRAGDAYWKGLSKDRKPKGDKGGGIGDILGDTASIIKESTRTGKQIADAIKDAIFGDEQLVTVFGGSGSPKTFEIRSGGLIDKLGQLGTFLGTVGGHLNNLNGLLGGNGPLVLGILALIRLLPGAGLIGSGIKLGGSALAQAMFGGGGGGTAPRTGAGSRGGLGGASGLLIASLLNGVLREPGPLKPDEYGNFGMTGYDLDQIEKQRRRNGGMGGGNRSRGKFGRKPPDFGWQLGGDSTLGGIGDFIPAPGFGTQQAPPVALMPMFSNILRRYMGESSPLLRTQEDQLGSLFSLYGTGVATADASATTATQTKPIGDGSLGVVNPNFGTIGTIDRFTANKVPIDNANGTYLGIWPTGGKALPVKGDTGGNDGIVRNQLTVLKSIASHTQSTSARLGNGGDIVYWLKLINTSVKGRPAGAGTSSLRP